MTPEHKTLIDSLDAIVRSWCTRSDELGLIAGKIEDGISAITSLSEENARLREVISWANNSLFGSHGFFLSKEGGQANVHHLDAAIEELKEHSRKNYLRATSAEARLAEVEGHARFWEERYREAVRRADEGPVEMPS